MSTATADIYDAPQADLGLEIPTEQSGIFGFKGRLSVLGYMARSAILLLAMAVLGLGMFFAVGGMSAIESGSFGSDFPLVLMGVLALGFLPLFYIGLALMVKRLHDISRSGWWMLLSMVPIVGLIYTLYISLAPGKNEGNRFGQANPAQGWEKPVGIIGIVLTVALVGGSLAVDAMTLFGSVG